MPASLPLHARSRKRLEQALALIEAGNATSAEQHLIIALAEQPGHPELLFGLGALQLRRGYVEQATATLCSASGSLPLHVGLRVALASAFAAGGRNVDAFAALEHASRHAEKAVDWLAIGLVADREGYHELAGQSADRTLALDRGNAQALLLRARSAQILGRIDSAARDYRAATRIPKIAARAWFALVDLKTVRLEAAEVAALERAASRAETSLDDRTMLAFALGKALEDSGEAGRAFEAFGRANELARMQRIWNAKAFSTQVTEVAAAFDATTSAAPGAAGREVIFLVGLPRSGTTLIEQVLAAHSQVEGASELPYLHAVIEGESKRRRQPFPEWVPKATPEDWQRMGAEYLRLSERWRASCPIATDKLPENWLLAGAALLMLPGARVIDCRRDAVETCWSCYKQMFAPNRVGFAYDFGSLAAYWHDYVRLGRFWAARFPDRYRLQRYEEFQQAPEAQTRALLEFCALNFEPGCLRFHEVERSVRSASAAQVRQPLQRNTARAASYGALMDPLRSLLARE